LKGKVFDEHGSGDDMMHNYIHTCIYKLMGMGRSYY